MELVIIAIVVGAFFALIAWLRSSDGELKPPGDPGNKGDANDWPVFR